MACLSPSPSGRRLSELLEEKQEPFFLDLHLLEKGCSSSRLLDGYDTALCWPAAPGNDNAAAAVLKRLTTSKKNNTSREGKKIKKQQPAGLLKLLLSKIILRGKADGRKKPAALQFSDSFKAVVTSANPAAVAPAPCADRLGAVKTAGSEVKDDKVMTHCSDSDSDSYSDDDEEKQLSPVSVLEHPFESSPVHIKLSPINGKLSPSRNTMDVFRDLLDAAYSPALLTQLLAKSDDLTKNTASAAAVDDDEADYYYYGSRSSPKNSRYDDAAYWEAHKAELARVSELVASEVPNARLLGHADLLAEREDVGAGVAAAVLEALLQELVADLGRC